MRIIKAVVLSVLLLCAIGVKAQEDFKSEEELKAKATELFNEQALVKAEPLYAQLLSLYPKDPEYNFKYGACLLAANSDKEKSLKYLQFAASKANVDPLAYFYLGRVHHLNYNFQKAVKAYSKFKTKASADQREKYQVERQIEMCKNGNQLLSRINEVQVLDKQEISEKDFYRIYDLKGINGKIISKPEDFKSKYDKKIQESSIIYLPNEAKEVYYSSYGKKGENGRDIYRVVKLGNDSWSDPVRLGNSINTPYDENFAFIHPDGRTLYFGSQGHSSMGGYDLFQSTFDDAIQDWTAPVNLDFAFSSVDDDVLFITDEDKVLAFFASNRSNADGKYTVYKVKVQKDVADMSVIQGSFITENNPNQKKAKITVIDQATNQTVGVYETDEAGNYQVEINENGGTYKFNVETTADAPIHTGIVNVPEQDEFQVLGQELQLVGEGDQQVLVIKNIFDGTATPRGGAGPQISSAFLRKKASLDINLSEQDILAIESETANAANTASNAANQSSSEAGNSGTSGSTANSAGLPSGAAAAGSVALGASEAANSGTSGSNANAAGIPSETGSLAEGNSNSSSADLQANAEVMESEIKAETEKNKQAAAFAYQEASNTSQAATKLFDELEEMKKNGSASETEIQDSEEEAKRMALQSAYSLKMAKELEKASQDRETQLTEVEKINTQIENQDLAGAELNSSALQQKLSTKNTLEESIQNTMRQTSSEMEQNAEGIAQLSQKQKAFESEIEKINAEIEDLKLKNESAEPSVIEENNKRIAGFEIDKQDMDYQIQNVAQQKERALRKESALIVKLEQLESLESQWSTASSSSLAAISAEEKTKTENEIKGFRDQNQLAFDGEDVSLSSNKLLLTEKSPDALASQVAAVPSGSTSTSPVSGKPALQINSFYETELLVANNEKDGDLKLAKQIQTYDSWESELLNRKESLVNQQSLSPDEAQANEILSIESQLNLIAQEKQSLSSTLLANNGVSNSNESSTEQNGQRPETKADPTAYKPNESVGTLDVSGVDENSIIPEDYTTFDMDQEFVYTNPQTVGSLSAAKKSFAAGATYGKKAQDARAAAYDLPSVEERNLAFDKAIEYEKASQQKQVEAGVLLGETNANEYNRNASQIQNAMSFGDDFESQNLDIATLLVGEAEVYYNKALEERASLDPSSRLSQQEVSLQKAYDYEMLALRKQKEAAVLLKVVDSEYQSNPNARAFDFANVTETSVEQVASSASPSANLVQPAQVNNQLRSVELDTVVVDAERKAVVQNSSAYMDFVSEANKREQALNAAQIDYDLAVEYDQKKQQLLKEATVLRSNAAVASDPEEKARMIKSAEIIDLQVQALGNSIDSLNQNIEANNLIVSNSEESMQAILSALPAKEQLEIRKVASDSMGIERSGAGLALASAPRNATTPTTGSGNVSSNETSRQTEDLNSLPNSSNDLPAASNDLPAEPISSNSSAADYDVIPRQVKQAIFVKLDPNESAYSSSKPIPVNPTMPEGLVYKVQIGAFRNPIPQDLFKGFAPLMAEKIPSGITRYTAGIFVNEREAVGARNQIRNLGYPDAFVVAFLNGKRVSISQARKTDQSAAGLADADSPGSRPSASSQSGNNASGSVELVSGGSSRGVSASISGNGATPVINAASVKGLYYTVQIGVFSKPVPASKFSQYSKLNVIALSNGMTRYNAGQFEDAVEANDLKNEIANSIKDAFVTAYYNGKRISLGEAARISNQ